jgi:hypothetical protein
MMQAWTNFIDQLRANIPKPDVDARATALHSQHSIAIHFGLLDLTAEGLDTPVNDLALARKAHAVENTAFIAPRLGEIFNIRPSNSNE